VPKPPDQIRVVLQVDAGHAEAAAEPAGRDLWRDPLRERLADRLDELGLRGDSTSCSIPGSVLTITGHS